MKAAMFKETKDLKAWASAVRNHFWYAAKACAGDADLMKVIWIGLLHHVAGEHVWATGQCEHGPMPESEHPQLMKGSPAWEKIR